MKLSIIIPYHNTYELTLQLLETLKPQLNDKTEVLIVNNSDNINFDDKYIKTLYCGSNGTASLPRNIGIELSNGEYLTFIDSDDMVMENYIEKILNKIDNSDFDYCLFSWKYKNAKEIVIKDNPPEWNHSVWNCVYKKTSIENERFNEEIKIAEDLDFNNRVRKGKKENIEDVLYIYNFGRSNSLMNGGA